ncbi:hypothetical protein [Nitratifractor sp.]
MNSIQGPGIHPVGEFFPEVEALEFDLRKIVGKIEVLSPFSSFLFSLCLRHKREKRNEAKKREKRRGTGAWLELPIGLRFPFGKRNVARKIPTSVEAGNQKSIDQRPSTIDLLTSEAIPPPQPSKFYRRATKDYRPS